MFATCAAPAWDPMRLDLERDLDAARRKTGNADADDPNLRPFFARGGKLLQWHGWNDAGICPFSSIAYCRQVSTATKRDRLDDSYRLFMAPGVGHCMGGDGPASSMHSRPSTRGWTRASHPIS